MTLLELTIASEIRRYLKDAAIHVVVHSTPSAVEIEATRGSVTRRFFDKDPCRHGTIVSVWCRRTAERIGRLVLS